MKICIGIDPSINSTGICVLRLNEDMSVFSEAFYIIKNGHLTKREQEAQIKYRGMFEYRLYEKLDPATAEDNHEAEYFKTMNMINLIKQVNKIVDEYIYDSDITSVYILQEGISYGSTIRTKAVFDLAGLNYMIRANFIERIDNFIIATPAEVKKFTTGSGNCKKEQMVELFKITHSSFELPKIDDVADSYWMATYAKKIMCDNV